MNILRVIDEVWSFVFTLISNCRAHTGMCLSDYDFAYDYFNRSGWSIEYSNN